MRRVIAILILSAIFMNLNILQPLAKNSTEFVHVKILTRPDVANDEIVFLKDSKRTHMAIISEILPHGIWEIGSSNENKILSTNTAKDLSIWKTHFLTKKYIDLGDGYIKIQDVEVNKEGLFRAIKYFEAAWTGIKFEKGKDNYAIESVIYGAGGDITPYKMDYE